MELKIYKHKIPNWEDHRDILIGMIPDRPDLWYDHETDFFEKHEQGWHHTDYLKESKIEYREYVHNLIRPLVQESVGNDKTFDLLKTWYSRQRKGEGHPEHDHGTIGLASVVYVKFNPKVHKPTEYRFPKTNVYRSFPVEEGEIVLFPSLLKHRAPPNEVDEERIIVAINIAVDN